MCRVLGVSESGYYAWCKRLPSRRQGENEQLVEHIRSAYDQGRHVYGSPRIHAELRAQGIVCGKHRVARLMQQAGLRAVQKRRRVCTTDSHHSDPVAPNLLQRDFTAPAPNRKWLTDITAVWTAEGWLAPFGGPGRLFTASCWLGNGLASRGEPGGSGSVDGTWPTQPRWGTDASWRLGEVSTPVWPINRCWLSFLFR